MPREFNMKKFLLALLLMILIQSCSSPPEIFDNGNPGRIRVMVFNDQNRNRIMDEGETGVKELVGMVREKIGAVACFKEAHVVPRLPKTRSGKTLRKTIRQIVNGEEYVVPSTIDDPASLDEISALVASLK